MHTTRGTIGFVTLLAMVCGLVLAVFSSPAAAHRAEAHRIVVTTNKDVVDPPFNPAGLCGTRRSTNLPGADGKISLREALIAANNTPGAKSITFVPTSAALPSCSPAPWLSAAGTLPSLAM